MAIEGEGCEVDPVDERCVQSISIPYKNALDYLFKPITLGYETSQECTITNPPAVPISVETFAVEIFRVYCADYLSVNGVLYCSTEGPEGIVPDGSPIKWSSDRADIAQGWKICFPRVILE
eukprot:scaffold122226_cov60-Phaeocystis_antarctica.AAC.1